jgi:hypothetical protein
MTECDKRETNISSKLHMIYLYLLIVLDTLFPWPSLHFTQFNLILEQVHGRYVTMWLVIAREAVMSVRNTTFPLPPNQAFIVSRLDIVNRLVTSVCCQFARSYVTALLRLLIFPVPHSVILRLQADAGHWRSTSIYLSVTYGVFTGAVACRDYRSSGVRVWMSMVYWWNWHWQGKSEILGQKPIPRSLFHLNCHVDWVGIKHEPPR